MENKKEKHIAKIVTEAFTENTTIALSTSKIMGYMSKGIASAIAR